MEFTNFFTLIVMKLNETIIDLRNTLNYGHEPGVPFCVCLDQVEVSRCTLSKFGVHIWGAYRQVESMFEGLFMYYAICVYVYVCVLYVCFCLSINDYFATV